MKWLNNVVEKLMASYPEGEIVVSSGVTPSGKYHLGTLREILTAEAIRRELDRRGRVSRHIHMVDDFDVFRKVPADMPSEFKAHLGKPLYDIPAPDGSHQSYADYFVADLLVVVKKLNLQVEIVRAHQEYQAGFFVPAIERTLDNLDEITSILIDISGHKLGDNWSPVQVVEDGYLKTRRFLSLNRQARTITYQDADDRQRTADYARGEVKLNWRIDWPARWWLMGVQVEPFGRDHATKGGSYDTGKVITERVFEAEPPLPVPYHFINRTGETKKMSKSAGNVVTATGLLDIMPPEVIWYFILRSAPGKQLFFDEGNSLIRLFDEFAALQAKPDKTPAESQLLELSLTGVDKPTLSNVPFSHLVASYQASLRNPIKTLEVIERTEHKPTAQNQAETIKRELAFIDSWLDKYAPGDVKFSVQSDLPREAELNPAQQALLGGLADAAEASRGLAADGKWWHERIYELKGDMPPAEAFQAIYRVILGQNNGPQAGWFLASLDKDWLIKRLRRQA